MASSMKHPKQRCYKICNSMMQNKKGRKTMANKRILVTNPLEFHEMMTVHNHKKHAKRSYNDTLRFARYEAVAFRIALFQP